MGSLCLSVIADRLRAHWLVRRMILTEVIWIYCAVGKIVEAKLLFEDGVTSSVISVAFTMFHFLLPSVFMAAVVTVLFQPRQALHRYLYQPQELRQTAILAQGS